MRARGPALVGLLVAAVIAAACGSEPEPGPDPAPATAPNERDELRITPVVELSSEGATIAPSLDVSVARTRDGGFAVSPRYRPAAILFYDAEGSLTRTFDQRGSGPGELEAAPLLFVDREGRLWAMDRQRHLVLDQDLTPLDMLQAEGVVFQNAVFLRGGGLATDHRVTTQDGQVFTVSVLGEDGRIVNAVSPRRNPEGLAVLGPAAEGGFWAAEVNHSRITRHDADGEPVHTVTVSRSWFEPWEGRIDGEVFGVRPRPRIWSVAEMEPGQLLLVTRVAADGWEPLWPDGTPGTFVAAEVDHSRFWDSIIEAVDASSGQVLARSRVPQALTPVADATGLFFSTRETALGHIIVEVVSVEVVPAH